MYAVIDLSRTFDCNAIENFQARLVLECNSFDKMSIARELGGENLIHHNGTSLVWF